MTVKLNLKPAPWSVPSYVTLQSEDEKIITVRVSEIDGATLDNLVKDWLAAVYKKAGKDNPWFCARVAKE